MTVVKFPYGIARRAHARKPRRSKNGTPEERAAKAAAATGPTATVVDLTAPAVATPALQVIATGDPAFALIAKKRAADVAHGKAIDAEDAAESRHGRSSLAAAAARDNCGAAFGLVEEFNWALATTPPTSLAGVAAVLRFANEIEDAGGEWPNTDTIGREGWHYKLRATMAAAVEAIMRDRAPARSTEEGPSFVEFLGTLKALFLQEFAAGKDVDQIFGALEDSYPRGKAAKQKFLEQQGADQPSPTI